MVVLDYANPVAPPMPAKSTYPAVEHLPRMGTVLVGHERLALLINAIDGTPVEEVEGQIRGQALLSTGGELGVVLRVPRHFVQTVAKLKAADIPAVASRWKPSLAAGPEHGDDASQPPLEKRKEVLFAAIELSRLALRTNRDLFLWEIDF